MALSGVASGLTLVMMNVSVPPDVADDAAQALETLSRTSFDWNHHAEIQSGENSAAGGEIFYSDVSRVGQVWLLRQRAASSSEWRRYGMVTRNRRVYFANLDHRPTLLGAACAECHPNGPRALRGDLRAGTETERDAINRIVTNVHVVRLYYAPSQPAPTTDPLGLPPCANCHDGNHRARLTAANHRAIAFQLAHAETPPHSVFTPEQRRQVVDWLDHHN